MPIIIVEAELERAAQSGQWQTGLVHPDNINKVTRRLRNIAKKLDLTIEIRTSKQEGKVSFRCQRKDQISIS